jgi:Asp-tRNA(Asn)/Glu-tRNA(Gln) amidotransferase A subunit family amidase
MPNIPFSGNINVLTAVGPMAKSVEDLELVMKAFIQPKAYISK